MFAGKKILAIIPASTGSQTIPGVHLRKVNGKTLLGWTIESARKSKYLDKVIVSSDDLSILLEAKQFQCEVPFIRPKELAQDDTAASEAVLHALSEMPGYDYVAVLSVTSPLRTAEDIDHAIRLCVESSAPACASVMEPAHHVYKSYTVSSKQQLRPAFSKTTSSTRCELPAVFVLNDAVYVANCEWFKQEQTFITSETVALEMPRERSMIILSEYDLKMVEMAMKFQRSRKRQEKVVV